MISRDLEPLTEAAGAAHTDAGLARPEDRSSLLAAIATALRDRDDDVVEIARRESHLPEARLRGVHMPPVQLIELGGRYYVRDGHHRISVAKALGESFVDAEVVRWQLR